MVEQKTCCKDFAGARNGLKQHRPPSRRSQHFQCKGGRATARRDNLSFSKRCWARSSHRGRWRWARSCDLRRWATSRPACRRAGPSASAVRSAPLHSLLAGSSCSVPRGHLPGCLQSGPTASPPVWQLVLVDDGSAGAPTLAVLARVMQDRPTASVQQQCTARAAVQAPVPAGSTARPPSASPLLSSVHARPADSN